MLVLGVSAFYHDSAAALVRDGVVLAAAQEERFTRVKHDPSFPAHAVRSCLASAGVSPAEVDRVVFYEKPRLKLRRLLATFTAYAPSGFDAFDEAMSVWLGGKLRQEKLLRAGLASVDPALADPARLRFAEHHQSHAASAFYPSPFDEAVVLTMDGVGEWATLSAGIGSGARLVLDREMRFPHSLGMLYSAVTYYTGFKVNSGEYKVMGLAPYGVPRHAATILDELIDLKADGTFRLNMDYFDFATGFRMTNERFDALFGAPRRRDGELLTPFHMDMAASIQAATEEIVLRMTRALAAETGRRHLCLAGGVALNCVANGKVLRDGRFDDLWIQPAAGDAGGAVGAALAAYYDEGGERPARSGGDGMAGAYLGPEFADDEIARRLKAAGAVFSAGSEAETLDRTAAHLAAGKAVGWFSGRMEFGPRALGARSIIADARGVDVQRTLNLKVKFRESFRPFAPAVLAEDVSDWFELDRASPYMLLVADVKAEKRRAMTDEEERLFGIDKLNVVRSSIPAVTHVDYSARIQTVHRDTNPRFHGLISRFKALTGCPVIVNTSFNVRGEPIVHTPEDAFRCFMGTGLDILVAGNCILEKSTQDPALALNYETAFAPD
jgi:carbamoyltransferase